jgi:orotidine-5'-phosphate decarboxylase
MNAQPQNFADRLLAAIDDKGGAPVCVGLDPVYERLPAAFRHHQRADDETIAAALLEWCRQVLEAVAPIVPAVKPQSAYFERYRSAGVEAYFDVVRLAREMGLIVIGDVKRNDIGSTAQAYAAGHLGAADSADAVTVNPYLGDDGVEPFVKAGGASGRGLFVLVRTSNPSGAVIQDFTDAGGTALYEHVAAQVAKLGQNQVGACGYSSVGAVVGATYVQQARRLRELMPQQIFLVPGYGAQGASAADCAASFKSDGTGAIVNASRSVIYAYLDASNKPRHGDWRQFVAQAAREFAGDIRAAAGGRA